MKGWWRDEVAHAGAEHLDPDYVAGFDRKSPTDWSETIGRLSWLGMPIERSPPMRIPSGSTTSAWYPASARRSIPTMLVWADYRQLRRTERAVLRSQSDEA